MTEVRRSPTPRFSDEAVDAAARRIASMVDGPATYAAGLVLANGVVESEFDAACLSAWRSGQRTAGRGIAERLRAYAQGKRDAADAARTSGNSAWAAAEVIDAHRFLAAADLIEQWTGASPETPEAG